jgi:hypothetical protein
LSGQACVIERGNKRREKRIKEGADATASQVGPCLVARADPIKEGAYLGQLDELIKVFS